MSPLAPSLIAALAFVLPAVHGQAFCTSGILPCAANAACDATTDKCQCSAPNLGDGRVLCTDTTRCGCSALADPHFGTFDSGNFQFTTNLPCSVTMFGPLALFLSATSQFLFNSELVLHPETRGDPAATSTNLRVFAKELAFTYTVGTTPGGFNLGANGISPAATGTATVTQGIENGFRTATITDWNLKFGYNSTYGGAYFEGPPASSTTNYLGQNSQVGGNLCGDCNGNDNEGFTTASNGTQLAKVMRALATSQVGPFATECTLLKNAVSGGVTFCGDAAHQAVLGEVCGKYLTEYGTCLVDDASVTSVNTFNALLTVKLLPCVTAVCSQFNVVIARANACSLVNGDITATCNPGVVPGC